MDHNIQSKPPEISLLLADVDGTLVTKQKVLTDRACAAVRKLNDAGIDFTITSGRPPLGMKMMIDALQLTAPIAAFNGAIFLRPDFSISPASTSRTLYRDRGRHARLW